MESIFLNGGMIGATLNFGSTEQYVVSATDLEYVGGGALGITFAQNVTFSLTSLTGGIDTAPSAGDIVIAAIGFRKDAGNVDITCTSPGYTEIADLYSNDTYDENLAVYYKVLTTAETEVSFDLGTTTANSGAQCCFQVWRNLDSTSPLDVIPILKTAINSGVPTAPAISTATSNSIIITIGAAAGTGLANLTVPSGMTNLVQTGGTASQVAMASYLQTTLGLYNPAAFGGGSTSTASSYCAVTLALRRNVVYGNLKNSGVWNLQSAFDYKFSTYGTLVTDGLVLQLDAGNSSSYPGSGTTWTDLSGTNNGTLVGNISYTTLNGGGLVFDGVDDYVNLGTINTNETNNTFIFQVSVSSGLTLIAGAGTGYYQIRFNDFRNINLVKSQIVEMGTFTGFAGDVDTVYNIAVTRDGSTYSLYVDGVYISSLTSTQTFTTTSPRLGINILVEEFAGTMYGVYFYNRTLSTSEILQNYNAMNIGFS